MSTDTATRTNASVASAQSEQKRPRARELDKLVMSEVCDPRPDIAEDSYLWTKLLKQVWMDHGDHWSTNAYAMLHGMRCCGMTIDLIEGKAGFRLVPLLSKQNVDPGIDGEADQLGEPHGVGDLSQWVFEAHYKKDREAALVPHKDEVVRYLKWLWDSEEQGAL